MNSQTQEKNLRPQGQLGSPRGRRDTLVIVPGRVPSSSNDGPGAELPASSASELAIAEDTEMDDQAANDDMSLPLRESDSATSAGRGSVAAKPAMELSSRTSPASRSASGAVSRATSPITTGEKRKLDFSVEKSPASDVIKTKLRNRNRIISDTSSSSTVIDDCRSVDGKHDSDKAWTSASSSASFCPRSQKLTRTKKFDNSSSEKGKKKRRKMDVSPRKRRINNRIIESESPLLLAPNPVKENKLELINQAGSELKAGLEKLGDPSYDLMTGCDLGAYAVELLENLEKSRLSSRAFVKGTLQGELKKGYETLAKIINTFVAKIEAKGDSAFYKHHLELYKIERNKMKEENIQLKRDFEKLKKEFYDFKNSHTSGSRIIRRPIESSSSPGVENIIVTPDISHLVPPNDQRWEGYRENFPPLPSRSHLSPVMRPPIQGKSVPIPEPPAQLPLSKAESEVDRIDSHITALKMAKSKIMEKEKASRSIPDRNKTSGRNNQDFPRESKKGPRVVEDLTILPPRKPFPPSQGENSNDDWIRVESRNRGNKSSDGNGGNLQKRKDTNTNEVRINQGNLIKSVRSPSRKRPPRSSAIAIKAGDGVSYADVLKKIKQGTSLSDYGIDNVRIRKAANRSTLLEISGIDNATKADVLANKFQEIVGNMAKITRPIKRADVRIIGFDESVLPEEIECAISDSGNCKIEEIRVGRIIPPAKRVSRCYSKLIYHL